MSAKIPPQVAETELSYEVIGAGLPRSYQGKVRDTHTIPEHPGHLLLIARIV